MFHIAVSFPAKEIATQQGRGWPSVDPSQLERDQVKPCSDVSRSSRSFLCTEDSIGSQVREGLYFLRPDDPTPL